MKTEHIFCFLSPVFDHLQISRSIKMRNVRRFQLRKRSMSGNFYLVLIEVLITDEFG